MLKQKCYIIKAILHFSFFIEFCEAKFPLGEPLRWATAKLLPARVGLSAPSPAQLRLRGWFRYYPSRNTRKLYPTNIHFF
jgi:hypothetical protein